MKTCRFILPLSLLLAACGADPSSHPSAAAPARESLNERMSSSNGYKQDADGNWVPQSDKRSSFEGQGESHYAKKGYQKQAYKTGDYSKKSWWGSKQYDRKAYSGNTDGSRFQKNSSLQGQGAREAGNAARIPDPYGTNTYGTSAAHEAGLDRLKKPSNAEIDNRQEVFQQPEIIDWREQRSVTMEQSKGILGR
jgi:hypothetical protein